MKQTSSNYIIQENYSKDTDNNPTEYINDNKN